MSVTTAAPVTMGAATNGDEPVDRFILPVLQQLLPAIGAAAPSIFAMFQGRRGLDDQPVSEAEAVRDFGQFLQGLLPTLLNVVPQIITQIQQQSRDLPSADVTRDPEAYNRWLGGLLSSVVPMLVQQLPGIIAQVTGKRDMRVTDPEVQERWLFPLLSTVVPLIAQSLPGIINAVKGR